MGTNYLVVGEDHMLGPSCQRYNRYTGRCGSIAFGSSPRRDKTLISNPRCLTEVSTSGKDFRRKPPGKIKSGAPKGGLMLNSDLSPAAPQGGREPPQKNLCGVHAQAGPDKLGLRLDIAAIH